MKRIDLKKNYNKSVSDLKREIEELKKNFLKARVDMLSGREKNLKKAKNIRKEIAQFYTILRIKEIQERLQKRQ